MTMLNLKRIVPLICAVVVIAVLVALFTQPEASEADLTKATAASFKERLEAAGVEYFTVSIQQEDEILIEMPGADEAEGDRVMRILQGQDS